MTHSRKDITLKVAMGAMALFAVYNFVLKPQRSSLASVRSDREGVEQSISAAQLALQAPLDTVPSQPGGNPDALTVAVPADPAVSTLLRQLQGIATDTGVLQGSITPSPLSANPSGPGGSLQVAITASGPHDATQAYLQRLRDLERLFVIEQIGVSLGTDGTEQLQISGRVFTQQTPVVAAAAVPVPVSTP